MADNWTPLEPLPPEPAAPVNTELASSAARAAESLTPGSPEAAAMNQGMPKLVPGEPQPEASELANARMDAALNQQLEEQLRQFREQAEISAANEAADRRADWSKAAADVGWGATEVTRQTAHGVIEGIQELGKDADAIDKWLQRGFFGGEIQLPEGFPDASNLATRITAQLPELDEPKTVTGGLIYGFARFITPFLLARKPAAGVVGKTGLTGKAAEMATSALAGGAADLLLSAEANLSNFIQDTPLANPVSEFLAIDGDDSEAAKRIKTAAEGMGIGLISDGLLIGLRSLRNARQAMAKASGKKPVSMMEQFKAEVGEITEEDIKRAFGEDLTPTTAEVKSQVLEQRLATGERAAKASEKAVGSTEPDALRAQGPQQPMVNWSRIDEPDDVLDVFRGAINLDTPGIQDARRLGRTFEKVMAEAEQGDLSILDILNRKEGSPFSDVETQQLRTIMNAASEKVLALQQAAMNGGTAEVFAFRKALVIHNMLLKPWFAARADASRSLGAWRIKAGSDVERAMMVQAALEASGGKQVGAELALRLSTIKDARSRAKMIERSATARTMDAVKEAYVMGLLTSPKTHLANIMSNVGVVAMEPAERLAGAGVSKLMARAPGEGIEAAEAGDMAFATVMSLRDAFRAASKRLRTGESAFGGITGDKYDVPVGKISADAFQMSETGMGRVANYLGKLVRSTGISQKQMEGAVNITGSVVRSPGTALMAEDEFFKMIGYRAELYALARRESRRQQATQGLTNAQTRQIAAEIIENPPDSIRISAIDAAAYRTFTRKADGAVVQVLQKARNTDHPANLTYLILPFLNTPANVFSYGFERTPLAVISKTWRADIAAGGARRDLALARTATGTAAMMLALDMADSGFITGSDQTLTDAERQTRRRLGVPMDAIFVPGEDGGAGKYIGWSRFDQIGPLMSFAAELNQVRQKYDVDDFESQAKIQELIAAGAAAAAHATVDRSFTVGVADFFEMMSDPQKNFAWYVDQRVKGFVPFSGAVRTIEAIADPQMRDTNVMLFDALKGQLVGLSSSLPTRRDLWGYPIQPDPTYPAAFHALSPVPVATELRTPIDLEMLKIGRSFEKIGKKGRFTVGKVSVEVNFRDFPRAYERYQELAGHDFKHPLTGQGAQEFLNDMVSGRGPMGDVYPRGSDEDKGRMIESVIVDFRKAARAQLMEEPGFEDFQDYIRGEVEREQLERMTALGGRR